MKKEENCGYVALFDIWQFILTCFDVLLPGQYISKQVCLEFKWENSKINVISIYLTFDN